MPEPPFRTANGNTLGNPLSGRLAAKLPPAGYAALAPEEEAESKPFLGVAR